MITNHSQYLRSVALVKKLEKKVRDGTATEKEKQRYHDGLDHCLIYDWAEEGKRQPVIAKVNKTRMPPPKKRRRRTGGLAGLPALQRRA